MIYYFLTIFIFLAWVATNAGKLQLVFYEGEIKLNAFLVLSLSGAGLLLALRGRTVGVDTDNYNRYFYEFKNLNWRGLLTDDWNNYYFTTEKGFMVLGKILTVFFANSQVLIIACAIIYCACMYAFYSIWGKNSLIIVSCFLCVGGYLMAMNVMRQSLAVGFCCLSWTALQNKKYKKMALWFVLAVLFHKSSIIMVLCLVIKKMPSNRLVLLTIGAFCAAFLSISNLLIAYVLQYFPDYSIRYGHNRWEISEAHGIVLLWVIILLVVLYLFFIVDWKAKENHILFEIVIMSMMYLLIQLVGQSYDGFQRLSMFFQPYLVLLFDYSHRRLNKFFRPMYTTGVAISMFLLFLRMAASTQYIYTPFWN